MPVATDQFQLATRSFCDTVDITQQIIQIISDSGISAGICAISTPGSTASITTIEFEPGVVRDLKDAIERIAPQDIAYRHNERWGDGNGFSHVRSALLGPSISLPIINSMPVLGTWQQIVLIDFDNRSRNRTVVVSVIGE